MESISNLNFYLRPLLAMVLSLSVLIAHSNKFKFLLNRSSIYLTLILPVCILLLTQTIATNLYLSLGLIGALSIVRYRTPVKNQYELAYLFSLISIGIITGVNPLYSILLTLILIFIPIAYMLFNKIFPKCKISYQRYYYENNHNVRFTFDNNIICNSINSNASISSLRSILEIKFKDSNHNFFTSQLGDKFIRFSKYNEAISKLYKI